MATAPRPQGGSSHRAATQPAPPPSIAHRVVNDEPISLDEYLEHEQESEKRHEYVDGWMISMVAASWSHSAITSDIDRTLGNQPLDTDCRTASRDLKVAPPSADKSAFPDPVVVCGGPGFDPDQSALLLNPRIVVEVLSPSATDCDRGEKFVRYRQSTPSRNTFSSPRTSPTSSTTSGRMRGAGASPKPMGSTPRSRARRSRLNFHSLRSILTCSRTKTPPRRNNPQSRQ